MVNVRKAVSSDLRSIAEYYGPKGDTPWDPFASEDRLKQTVDLNDLVIAEIDGSFVGFLYSLIDERPWFDLEVERYGHILEVHVKSGYQGMGIATRMIEYVMDDLKKRNVRVVYVDTRENNNKALHLYGKMGFKEFGRTIHLKKTIV
jgi:ribosomal protein S18 acetylase RimI-like enzyme